MSRRRRPSDREAALANLALRYVRSRGPVTLDDLAWWSGLTRAEARRGIAAVKGSFVEEVVGGRTTWRDAGAPAPAPAASLAPGALLLPAFDEYLVAYRDRDAVLDPRQAYRVNAGGGMLDPVVVLDGRVVGTWRRELGRRAVAIEVELFGSASPAVREAIFQAAQRYGDFLGLEPTVAFSLLGRGPATTPVALAKETRAALTGVMRHAPPSPRAQDPDGDAPRPQAPPALLLSAGAPDMSRQRLATLAFFAHQRMRSASEVRARKSSQSRYGPLRRESRETE